MPSLGQAQGNTFTGTGVLTLESDMGGGTGLSRYRLLIRLFVPSLVLPRLLIAMMLTVCRCRIFTRARSCARPVLGGRAEAPHQCRDQGLEARANPEVSTNQFFF